MEAYQQAKYPLLGHGKRDVQVLKEALEHADGDMASDMYGTGAVIEAYQVKMAELLGKEASVFFPSGTMAQQIALRIWADRAGSKQVAYHPLCHLEIHEKDGLKVLHGLEPVLLADQSRPVRLRDIAELKEDVACVLLELPQREIGGQLPPYEELESISRLCKERGIKLHLDGARLFEVLPYYGKTAVEVCALFDSVYISVYKGIGGIAGAILAGDLDFMEEAKPWKRRHGGDLISLYPYILAADYYMERRLPKMERYYREAVELAEMFNGCEGVRTLPEMPVSNMFHVFFEASKEKAEAVLAEVAIETGVGLARVLQDGGEAGCKYEVSLGDLYADIPRVTLAEAFRLLERKLRE
ncbi:beta-eliminating lyase-related protein [Paenibacillus sp. LHD-117]|uniref:threonine aldolase family protein n=1 Tax=Paenibacillus sp. LHD-117 TaxID=3071412 RepID=UPI0027E015CC|nr:beta-eliminating lyase-related protein [Paenibacillus sp. LHD-117]MDQ6419424.1 beta-eliminating lyase-related protein [Paenibacillus sp. LHD-117]